MKVAPLYLSKSWDSLNKLFANFQSVVSIENLSLKKAESHKISKDKNIGESGPTKVAPLKFSISRNS